MLQDEQEQYTETWGRRRAEFSEIVARLTTMSEAISSVSLSHVLKACRGDDSDKW